MQKSNPFSDIIPDGGHKMEIGDLFFRRKFSLSLYKSLKLKLAQADFSKDISENPRGNKYPLLRSEGAFSEKVSGGEYCFDGKDAFAERFISPFYPCATYEAVIGALDGECGFVFEHGGDRVKIVLGNSDGLRVLFEAGDKKEQADIDFEFTPGMSLCVLARKKFFDVYINRNDFAEYIRTFCADEFSDSSSEKFFRSASAGLAFSGNVICRSASVYDDSGIAQADIRPVCFENGDVITENGRMFFTASIRWQEGGCQGVFSWIPGTAEFELTGTLFFDAGDGTWESDVATCLVFDRNRKKWLLWVCSFSHGHILGHAEFDGEPRYGRNVIDITLVDRLPDGADDTVFGGKTGDEDPALTYDEKRNKWLLAVCRVPNGGHYRYFFFESDSPFDGFEYAGCSVPGSETGGSFFWLNGEIYFICGNSFDERACYRAYKYGRFDKPEKLVCDIDDGGFRGWGSVFSVNQGTRKRTFWLTFDRQKGSDFNWSYGNLYCYEA